MNHVVIYNKKLFAKDYIALILNGDRTLGCKFTTRMTGPYQKLKDGDYLYLKESSGPIRGRVRVNNVVNRKLTDPEDVMNFLVRHMHEIGIAGERQLVDIWRLNSGKQYLCYWTLEAPQVTRYPVSIQKNDRRAWVADYEVPEELQAAFL